MAFKKKKMYSRLVKGYISKEELQATVLRLLGDIVPEFDSLVAFPSFARHEVERTSCPGNAFADSRFSVNLWLCG